MRSYEATQWVKRWRYEMAQKPVRPGIWRLKDGGFFVRARVTDPRTGREYRRSTVLRGSGISLRDAFRAQEQLRSGHARDHRPGLRRVPLHALCRMARDRARDDVVNLGLSSEVLEKSGAFRAVRAEASIRGPS